MATGTYRIVPDDRLYPNTSVIRLDLIPGAGAIAGTTAVVQAGFPQPRPSFVDDLKSLPRQPEAARSAAACPSAWEVGGN